MNTFKKALMLSLLLTPFAGFAGQLDFNPGRVQGNNLGDQGQAGQLYNPNPVAHGYPGSHSTQSGKPKHHKKKHHTGPSSQPHTWSYTSHQPGLDSAGQ